MPAFWFLHPVISNGLALYLIPVTCSQGQTQGFFMTKNNYSISEIIFLSFLPSDHHFLSFQPPSLGPNTQVVPLFQKDLQPILTALSMNTLHPFSLPTHRRFHHHSHCFPFTLSYTLWKTQTLVEHKSTFSVPSPRQLNVAQKNMYTTTMIRVTLNIWPRTSAEPSAFLGIPTTFHSQLTLLFSHTSSSLWNFKHLLSFMFSWWLCFIRHWENRSHQEEIALFFLCQIEDPPMSEPLNPPLCPASSDWPLSPPN